MSEAKRSLEYGSKFPYDAPDAWWNSSEGKPPPAIDKAHAAARGILWDLRGRCDIKRGFEGIDEETRAEIVASMAEIIRAAMSEGGEHE